MHRRSVIGVVATATALCAPLALSSGAAGGVPVVELDKLHETVGQTVARAGTSLPQHQSTPVTRRPAPRPSATRPSPRPASAPAEGPARATAPAAPVRDTASKPAPATRASAPKARSSAKTPAEASGGANAAADPSDAVQADSGSAQTATAADSVGDADAGSLPFTGSTILPAFLVAVVLLMAGAVLRRTVRLRT